MIYLLSIYPSEHKAVGKGEVYYAISDHYENWEEKIFQQIIKHKEACGLFVDEDKAREEVRNARSIHVLNGLMDFARVERFYEDSWVRQS